MIKYLVSLGLFLCATFLSGQSVNTEFGKNRVQYTNNFKDWDKYETENFVTYWYGKGRKIGKHVVQYAEQEHDGIQDIMEHKMNDKIQIMVFIDLTDFKQSNIGNEEIFGSSTGQTKIVGNKMFVYFDGNHAHLRQQIKQGIARVYLNAMLYGSNIQEIVQNAVLLSLPEWYKEGVIQYAARPWDYQLDDELRDIMALSPKYQQFDKMAEKYPRIAGHSMWYYIDQNYGRLAISNLLYLTKISSDLDDAYGYVLNISEEQLKKDWAVYWMEQYQKEDGRFFTPEESAVVDLKKKDHVPISTMSYNADGSQLLYVHNDIGKYRIQLRDMNTGKEQTVFKYGHKNAVQGTDYQYPVIDWHTTPNEFSIIYEHRDVAYLRRYIIGEDLEYIEQSIPEQIWRVFSLDHIEGDRYLMSTNVAGFSDIIEYDANFREPIPLWEDIHDDLEAHYLPEQDAMLWLSNNPLDIDAKADYDTIIPQGVLAVHQANRKGEERNLVLELKHNIHDITVADDGLYYLADPQGMMNLHFYSFEDAKHTPLTNLSRNIINYTVHPDGKSALVQYYHQGNYVLSRLDISNMKMPAQTAYAEEVAAQSRQTQEEIPFIFLDRGEDKVMKEEYKFQSRFPDPEELQEIKQNSEYDPFGLDNNKDTDANKDLAEWNTARIVAGRKHFRVDNFVTKYDNSVLFEGLESYNNPTTGVNLAQYGIEEPQNQLQNPPNGLLFQATLKDLFEDDVFVGGVRLPLNFRGSEYFLIYENRKKLIDVKYSIYRRSYRKDYEGLSNFYKSRSNILYGEVQFKYPFDIYRSLRLRPSIRVDRFRLLVEDNETLDSPVDDNKRLGLKLEYVYDNTLNVSTNVLNGTRYKLYAEAYNRFKFKLVDGAEFSASDGFTSVVGLDFRHYFPVLRHSVFAVRGAGAASLGSEKVLYYLGGMEGALFQRFNEDTPFPSDDSFAFRTAAYQMRGFKNNIRNGSSFAVINAELRLSIFKHLLGANKGHPIFNEMQLVGFFDLGSSWHGTSPWSDDNPLNTVSVSSQDVIQLKIKYFRNPLVMGYGAGLRTSLFGYLVKLDYGWGVENGQIQTPRLHIGFGADF